MVAAPVLRQQAEALAATLPPLQLAAERIAMTVAQGVHGRRRVGQGETFWQFRQYQPGDARTRIDWRQSAKRQRLFVRETEWSAAQSVWLWRDGSPSMRYRSRPDLPEKGERAELLLVALATLLVRGGERIALLGVGRRPATGQSALNRVALQLLRPDIQVESLPRREQLSRHSHAVFFGDFLSPLPAIDAMVRGYAEQGINGHLVQLLDPAEATLPFLGRIEFEGMEGEGKALLSRVETVRDDYAAQLAAQIDGIADIARAVGWSFIQSRTDQPATATLLSLYIQAADRFRR